MNYLRALRFMHGTFTISRDFLDMRLIRKIHDMEPLEVFSDAQACRG